MPDNYRSNAGKEEKRGKMNVVVIDDMHFVPYCRMTQRSKYVDPRARAYLACKEELQIKIKNQMQLHSIEMMPKRTPLYVLAAWTLTKTQGHKADIDNYGKLLLDACNKIIIPDDRWVDKNLNERAFGNREHLEFVIGTIKFKE